MTIEALFHASVDEHGAVHFEDPEAFRSAKMAMRMKRITIAFAEYREPATEDQAAYYFGVVVKMIADRMGSRSRAATHELLKKQFLYDLEVVKIPGSTTEQDTKGMHEYIETIREWAAGEPLNLDIPDPDKARAKKKRKKGNG